MPHVLALTSSPEAADLLRQLALKGHVDVDFVGGADGLRPALRRPGVCAAVLSVDDLPGGVGALSELSRQTDVPLLALVSGWEQIKQALRAGADYSLRSPFDPDMFLAVLAAAVRRTSPEGTTRSRTAGLTVDPDTRTVARGGDRRTLSDLEWRLFAYLMERPGAVLGREEMAIGAWGADYAGRDGQIELYISRVRRRIEADPRRPRIIETVRGRGYRFNPEAR